jgi:hypothetical protein
VAWNDFVTALHQYLGQAGRGHLDPQAIMRLLQQSQGMPGRPSIQQPGPSAGFAPLEKPGQFGSPGPQPPMQGYQPKGNMETSLPIRQDLGNSAIPKAKLSPAPTKKASY